MGRQIAHTLVALSAAWALTAGPLQAAELSCGRLYVFGDSYSDSGYGYVDGDGPTAVVYLAHDLGITLAPADVGQAADSLNFAVSGAGTSASEGRPIGRALLGRGVLTQVADFGRKVSAGEAKFDAAETVFFIAAGLNDRRLTTEQIADNLGQIVGGLYQLGGRRFVMAAIPETLINPDVGARLNPALPDLARSLTRRYPAASVQVSDWGRYFDRVRAEGPQRGFTDLTGACAQRAIFRLDPTPCRNPGQTFYYHDGHPSTEVHRQVGELLAVEARKTWCPQPGTPKP